MAKKNTTMVNVEEGLDIEVSGKVSDVRVLKKLSKFMKYQEKIDKDTMSDSDGFEVINVLYDLIEFMIGEEQLETVADYYTEKHGEFSVDDMSLILEKVIGGK